jgi:hypothetical protein
MLQSLSNYHLIYELLHDGQGGIYPDIEPIDVNELLSVLTQRAGNDIGKDINQWVNWFLTTENVGTEKEKASIVAVKKIRGIEGESLSLLGREQ